jgi:hypothetical protein
MEKKEVKNMLAICKITLIESQNLLLIAKRDIKQQLLSIVVAHFPKDLPHIL